MASRMWTTISLAGVLLGICTACAMSSPLVVDFSETRTGKPLSRIEACVVRIVSVVDERKSKEDLGMFGDMSWRAVRCCPGCSRLWNI